MTAILSPCRRYRYRLERDVQLAGNVIAFFGINPSTADADEDDQTTRKLLGFAQLLGARRYLLGNVMAWRATDVRELADVVDLDGPGDGVSTPAELFRKIITDADVLVPCWGSRAKLPRDLRPMLDHTEQLLRASGKPVRVFGFTRAGDPLHPLMLGYATALVEWKNAA